MKKKKEFYQHFSVFVYENNVKYPIYLSKKCFEEKHVDLLLVGEKKKNVLIKDFNMIIHYTVEEKIFFVIICKVLAQKNIKVSC